MPKAVTILDKIIRRKPIPKNAPVYVPINSDADITRWMKSVGADPRDAYSVDDLAGAYWEILPEEKALYKKARRSRYGGRSAAQLFDEGSEVLEMSGGRVNRLPLRDYIRDAGWDADFYGMKQFPWWPDAKAAAKQAFPQLSPSSRSRIADWYEAEGALEDFESTEDLADFMEGDIYDMLDAADDSRWVRRVKKKLGYSDEF